MAQVVIVIAVSGKHGDLVRFEHIQWVCNFLQNSIRIIDQANEDASAPLRMVAPGVVREIIAVLIVSLYINSILDSTLHFDSCQPEGSLLYACMDQPRSVSHFQMSVPSI